MTCGFGRRPRGLPDWPAFQRVSVGGRAYPIWPFCVGDSGCGCCLFFIAEPWLCQRPLRQRKFAATRFHIPCVAVENSLRRLVAGWGKTGKTREVAAACERRPYGNGQESRENSLQPGNPTSACRPLWCPHSQGEIVSGPSAVETRSRARPFGTWHQRFFPETRSSLALDAASARLRARVSAARKKWKVPVVAEMAEIAFVWWSLERCRVEDVIEALE